MRFKLGFASGFLSGYYLGAKAGRQRYEQINQALGKVRRSPAYESASEKAKAAVGQGVEKAKGAAGAGVDRARSLVGSRTGNGSDDLPPARFT